MENRGAYMNIGLFTDSYYPEINGVSTSILILKENLEKLGHSVYVFTTKCPDAPKNEHNVFRVPSVKFNIRRLGTFINPRLKKEIKGLALDIIHTHTEFSLGIFGRSVAHQLRIPHIHTMHTVYEFYTNYIINLKYLETAAKAMARKFSASFCNSADQVIVPTEKMKKLLLEYGVRKNIEIVPTGIQIEKFSEAVNDPEKINLLKKKYKIAANDKVIINIGRMSKEKNLIEVFASLGNYLSEHSDIKFLLVGDGPDLEHLQQITAALGINEQVIFAGAQPWDEISLYYRLGDVFVSASQSETQGLTYIEALASGLPVAAKYDPCLDGVVINGENGYTFRERSELLAALDKILYNADEMKRLSLSALNTADKFSAAQFAASTAALYQKIKE